MINNTKQICKMKKIKIMLFIVFSIIIVFSLSIFVIEITPSLKNLSKPKITHGEFAFKLTYKYKNKKIVKKDVLICDYDGVEINSGNGIIRKWKSSLKSGNERITIIKNPKENELSYNNEKIKYKELFFDPGPASYYMGDGNKEDYAPSAAFYQQEYGMEKDDGETSYLFDKELLDIFDIEIIDFDIEKPITNSF